VSALRGADIDVYGPFGRFTPHRFQQHPRMVWIGSGIGITPFLSMLSFERNTLDLRQIWLYYVVRDGQDAVYDQEIRQNCSRAGSSIEYAQWVTSERGRLTAKRIAADVESTDYAVMICGSMPIVRAFTAQFRALGIPSKRIITEELQFRGSGEPRAARAVPGDSAVGGTRRPDRPPSAPPTGAAQ